MTKITTDTMPRVKGRPRNFDREAALNRALELFWHRGYEPTSISELCSSMGINPPSLYAAFGSKARLFLEAVDHYEKVYWDTTWGKMEKEPDLHRAIKDFFLEAANILTSPEAPCGCLVVLAAINVSPESQEVIDALKLLRQEGKDFFLQRLQRGLNEGYLPPDTDVKALANSLSTMLEGMSIQAQDGMSREDLINIATIAITMLPAKPKNRLIKCDLGSL